MDYLLFTNDDNNNNNLNLDICLNCDFYFHRDIVNNMEEN